MTKEDVILILNDSSSDKSKFSRLIPALQQAPIKNLANVSYYNKAGYSAQRFKTIVYDVKKSYSITAADLSAFQKVEKSKPEGKTAKATTPLDLKTALDVDIHALNYHKELRPLANDVADHLGEELESQKKADLIAYLEEKKSESQPQDEEE